MHTHISYFFCIVMCVCVVRLECWVEQWLQNTLPLCWNNSQWQNKETESTQLCGYVISDSNYHKCVALFTLICHACLFQCFRICLKVRYERIISGWCLQEDLCSYHFFYSNHNNHFDIISPPVLRCLMDSGGGTPPGPPPDPSHSTSAPSLPLPRARTWTAAVNIQSGGEDQFLGLTFQNIQHPGKCMKYSLAFTKIPPSLVPQDLINWLSVACNTCSPKDNDLLVGYLIDSFLLHVYILSIHMCKCWFTILSMFSCVFVCTWVSKGVCCLLPCCQQRVSGLRGFELIISSYSEF